MGEKHFVVVGNGPAGHEAALTLRSRLPEARISIISRNCERSYAPRLLPDFIAGRIPEEELFLVPSFSLYADRSIKLRCSQEAASVDLARRELVLKHKEVIPYDGLILAVGSKPRIPEPMLAYRDLIHTLKTVADAKLWRQRLARIDKVLLIGGDLTSLAVTRALLHLGKKVYFLLDEESFWPLRWDEALVAAVSDRLVSRGVEVLCCGGILSMAQLDPDTYEVRLEDGTLQVGFVGGFFGLVPDVGFLARSGLRLDRGILVDEYLNTGFADVYAAGDCAQIYHPEINDYWVPIGHDNARILGKIAALNLAGSVILASVQPESIFEVQGVNVNTSWWAEF